MMIHDRSKNYCITSSDDISCHDSPFSIISSFAAHIGGESSPSDSSQAGFPYVPYPPNFLDELLALDLTARSLAMSYSHWCMVVRGVERILKQPYVCSLQSFESLVITSVVLLLQFWHRLEYKYRLTDLTSASCTPLLATLLPPFPSPVPFLSTTGFPSFPHMSTIIANRAPVPVCQPQILRRSSIT